MTTIQQRRKGQGAALCLRRLGMVMILLAGLLSAGSPASPADAAEDQPGASQPLLSAAEIGYPPFSMVDAQGRATGFSVELMRAALAAMGRQGTFRTGPWPEVRGWLENGEIEALPLVGRTPEREALFDFTFPYMTLHGAIVVRKDQKGIQDLEDLRGRGVAVMHGDNAEEFLRREDRGIKIHVTPTFEQALSELSRGRHDAVVIQRLVALRLIQEAGLTNLRIINKPIEGFFQDFCFAAKEGDSETLALLNEGLALVMADGTYRRLHVKWFAAMELPANHRTVVGGKDNSPPFEFLDEHGLPAGFNVDITRAIAREMGLDIEIRLGSRADILEQLARGEIDVVQGLSYSLERDVRLDFTPPHTVNHCISVVRKGEGPPPESLGALQGRRIVVEKGGIMQDYAMENGLGGWLSLAATQEDALRELAEGKHDCALASRLSALYWIKEHDWTNLELGQKALLSPGCCYAVKKDQKALLAQFAEGLKVLDETGQYQRIYEKWMGVLPGEGVSMARVLRHAAMGAVPLLVLLLAALFWSWSLRKQVARRTEELSLSEELQKAMIACSPVALYSIDLHGNVQTWNQSAERIFGWKAQEVLGKPLPFVPEDKQEEFRGLRQKVMEGRSFSSLEVVRTRKDGSLFDASLSAAPIFNPFGQIVGIMASMEDITNRKKARKALEESQRRLNEAQFIARMGDFTWDVETGEVTWSDGIFALLQYNKAERIDYARVNKEIHHPDDLERVTQWLRNSVESGADALPPHEYRLLTRKGETVFVRTVGRILHREGKAPMVFATIQDITERRQAEESLRQSEERHRLLADNTLDVIWTMNMELEFTYVNPAITRMTGHTPGEWIGSRLFDHCDDANFARMADIIAGEMEKGAKSTGVIFETDMLKKNGDPIPLEIHGKVIFDKQWQPIGLQGTTRDITERRRAEESLRHSEQHFRNLADSGMALIWTCGLDKKCDYFNRSWLAFTGRTLEQELGDGWTEGVHPEDLDYCFATFSSAFDLRKPFSMIYRLRRHDGAYRWVQDDGSPRHDADGRFLGYIGHCLDITEIKAARERIEHLNKVLRTVRSVNQLIVRGRDQAFLIREACRILVDNRSYLGALIVLTDESGQPVLWEQAGINNAFQKLFPMLEKGGLPPCCEKIHPDRGVYVVRNREDVCHACPVCDDCSGLDSMCVGLAIDGETFGRLAVTLEKGVQEDPEEQGLFAEMGGDLAYALRGLRMERERDDSQSRGKALENQLLQAQKMESVGRLAGGVAHDFNNMLSVILMHAEMALNDLEADNPMRENLQDIYNAAKRSAEITRQLLAFARRQTISPRSLDLNETVEGILKMLRRLIGEDIDLAWLPAPGLWPVHIDPAQVDQILANLCINARDAIAGVGKITIETDNVSFDREYCQDHPGFAPGEFAMLAVSDNGSGMDKNTMDSVFEPFYTTKEVGKGTGLGLSTVYGIVKQNQGFINVYSEPGQGTVFKVYMPRYSAQIVREPEAPPVAAVLRGSETLLLVEDEPSSLKVVSKMLQRLGYTVLPASTPNEAIQLATAHTGKIDLLITDVVMPEMNGRDLAEKLTAAHPGLKVLFMSGYTANVIAHHGVLDQGVNFIPKPFSVRTMAEKLRQMFDAP